MNRIFCDIRVICFNKSTNENSGLSIFKTILDVYNEICSYL